VDLTQGEALELFKGAVFGEEFEELFGPGLLCSFSNSLLRIELNILGSIGWPF
jgi:hypothetical protein